MRRLFLLLCAFLTIGACQVPARDPGPKTKTKTQERLLDTTARETPDKAKRKNAEAAFGDKLRHLQQNQKPAAGKPNLGSGTETKVAGGPPRQSVSNVRIVAYGKQVKTGDVDLKPTINRILRGEKHAHHNDGSVFGNYEGKLPRKDRGYYREYVHPTQGIKGAGPQRLIVGKGGEWYYTPDHYQSFTPLQ